MKRWSDFYDLAVPDLPGCPFAVLDVALRQSAVAFCEQSLAWQAAHPEVPVVTGVAEYAFVPPEGAVVHAITYAEFDGKEIESRAGESNIGIAGRRNETGTPAYVLGGHASLTLAPKPGAAGTLTMTVALKPSLAGTGIDEAQFSEYRDAIVHGALARLVLSPRKPYTDARLAAHHRQQFSIKAAAAGTRVARSHTRGPLRTSIMARK